MLQGPDPHLEENGCLRVGLATWSKCPGQGSSPRVSPGGKSWLGGDEVGQTPPGAAGSRWWQRRRGPGIRAASAPRLRRGPRGARWSRPRFRPRDGAATPPVALGVPRAARRGAAGSGCVGLPGGRRTPPRGPGGSRAGRAARAALVPPARPPGCGAPLGAPPGAGSPGSPGAGQGRGLLGPHSLPSPGRLASERRSRSPCALPGAAPALQPCAAPLGRRHGRVLRSR